MPKMQIHGDNYTDFMYETGLIDHKIDAKDQYTNEFVK